MSWYGAKCGVTEARGQLAVACCSQSPATVKRRPRSDGNSPGQKTDEPSYYIGALEDLKSVVKAAGARLYIVEGEVDVWSLQALGIHNVIGTYSASRIPRDIARILDELGVRQLIYIADNDKSGDKGASKLATLLHQSRWQSKTEYRKITGPGIPDKGDANDLVCHHYPDISAARAALDALPRFVPDIKLKSALKPSRAANYSMDGWDAVNQAITNAHGLTSADFKASGFTKKNFRCLNPQHEDKTASAGWNRDGNYNCFVCGKIDSWQIAEWLNIDWRSLRWSRPQIASSTAIDLNAAPRQLETINLPPFFDEPPDSWLRLSNKTYSTMHSSLYYYATRLRSAGLLPEAFSVQEFIDAASLLGCELKDRAIYDNFEEARHGDDHPFFAKFDPSESARSWNRKFRLRSVDDILERLLRCIRFRVYEQEFQRDPNTIDEAPARRYAQSIVVGVEAPARWYAQSIALKSRRFRARMPCPASRWR